jgi:hypothetical protein
VTRLCEARDRGTGLCPQEAAGWLEGGCVHEHVEGGWLCAAHAASRRVLCRQCLEGPRPHVCPLVTGETAA